MSLNSEKPQDDTPDAWCKTDISARKTSQGTFTWTISGLDAHREEYAIAQDSERSKEFTLRAPEGKETKWMLELFPRSDANATSFKVAVHSRNKFDVKAKIELTIKDNTGGKKLMNKSTFNAAHIKTFTGGDSKLDVFILDHNSLRTNAATYLPNGELTFNLDLTLFGITQTTFGSKKANLVQTENNKTLLNICESLGEFFLSKELSDVLIECQDKTFEAHQVILSASSPVFRGMFLADMKEKKSQLVEIKDLEPGVVCEMLRYIYSGSCVATEKKENPDLEMVSDLLEASDKYQMVTLKNVCQSLLSSNLEVENSLKFLVLGDMYGAQELKEQAMAIVVNNMNGLIETEEVAEAMAKSAS